MNMLNTFKQAWDAMMDLAGEHAIEMEIYNGGESYHTDSIGEFIGNGDNKMIDAGIEIPDNAICSYQVMDKEEYGRTLLANTSESADDYFDELEYIVVVVVDFDGEKFATAD